MSKHTEEQMRAAVAEFLRLHRNMGHDIHDRVEWVIDDEDTEPHIIKRWLSVDKDLRVIGFVEADGSGPEIVVRAHHRHSPILFYDGKRISQASIDATVRRMVDQAKSQIEDAAKAEDAAVGGFLREMAADALRSSAALLEKTPTTAIASVHDRVREAEESALMGAMREVGSSS